MGIYNYYVDNGYSGTNFDRPELKRMLKDISNKVKTSLITKKVNGEYITSYAPYGYVKSRYEKNKIIKL